jgi:5-methylcytosine-specific restriction endonuclease McrA
MSLDREEVGPTPRKALSHKQRLEVLLAGKGRCSLCGEKIDGPFDVDHRIPLFRGGADDITNMTPMHPACHRGTKTPVDAKANAKLRRLKAKNDGTFPESKFKLKSKPFDVGARGLWK